MSYILSGGEINEIVELRGSEEMEEVRKWRSTGVSLAAEGLPADGMACYTRCDLEEMCFDRLSKQRKRKKRRSR
jgi:hypothetical protein